MIGIQLRIKPNHCIRPVKRVFGDRKRLTPLKKYLYSHQNYVISKISSGGERNLVEKSK
jgi:hypothetical protein